MTPAEALSLVRYQINETTAAFWSDAEIYAYMWEAENQLCSIVGYEQAVTAHTTITDTSVYTMPDDCLRISRVTYDNRMLPRERAKDIDIRNGTSYGTTTQAGNPEVYRQWGTNITLYPTPEEDKELYFEFYKAPTAINTASTEFDIHNVAIQQMIPDYCVMRCMLKDKEDKLLPVYISKWENNLQRAYSIASDENWSSIESVRDEDYEVDSDFLEIFRG